MSISGITRFAPFVSRMQNESEQDLVVRMIKGDFEKLVGMSFDRFYALYKQTIETNPERFV